MFSWGSVPVSTASLKWNVQGSSVIAGLSSSPRAALPVPPAPLGTPSIAVLSLQGQAQECLLEKSMLDNRKSFLVARISAQVSSRSCCQHGPAPTARGPGAAERGALGRSGDGGRNSWLCHGFPRAAVAALHPCTCPRPGWTGLAAAWAGDSPGLCSQAHP